jgi:hypothetical protein
MIPLPRPARNRRVARVRVSATSRIAHMIRFLAPARPHHPRVPIRLRQSIRSSALVHLAGQSPRLRPDRL